MKKNILLIIRRGQPELEWIAPILYKLKNEYNIFTFYLSQDALNNFSNKNPIYSIIKKTYKNIFVQKLSTNFFWRLLQKIFINNKYIISKIHNPSFLIKKLKIKGKIDIIFSEYGNKSEWIKSFAILEKKPLIVNYPSSPLSFGQGFKEKHKKFYSKKLLCDYVFLILKRDYLYWSKSIHKNKMLFFGNPSYDAWWIKKIYNNKKKTINTYYMPTIQILD